MGKMVVHMKDFLSIGICFMLLNFFGISKAGNEASNISCLKLIKDSIQDPFGYLESWNFNTTGEGFICVFRGIDCWHADENFVLAIRLADMGLNGQFPRGLEYCTSLTVLDLSHNNLTGPIPADISDKFKYITFLDLSFNQFSGTIPPEISKCVYLNTLSLNNNHLWGPIPHEIALIQRLKMFNVSNNGLTGPVPILHTFIRADSFENNPELCGYPLNPCKSGDSFVESFFGGFGIGWGLSFILILLFKFFGFPSMWLVFGIRKRKNDTDGGTESLDCKSLKISKLEKFVTRMSFTELADATANFSEENVIGIGKNGIMYRAFLPNGCSLAIKRLYASPNLEEQFVAEILSLGTQRHDNLLPLLGFCIEKKERFLVYKCMENGNLHDWLHQNNGDEARIIEWPLRMKISISVANGLAWLHHCCRVRIFHCNINSRCILLDHNYEPKISNFWKAKFMNVQQTTSADSSWSLFSSFESDFQMNSDKRDVYSFGLLLLELITGKELHAADFQENDNVNSLCDAGLGTLVGQEFDAIILGFYKVAKDCLNPEEERRPTMLEVHKRLREIKLRFDNACNKEISLMIN